MSDIGLILTGCGCCKGLENPTPQPIRNLPGLPTISYRVGTYGSFKAAMETGLSRDPGLLGLTTRDDSDPSLALIDSWAAVLDVLTFYQERIAQEGYLRTATERSSILELARSISYRLKPGVSASTYLSFELETALGSPSSALIDIGTRAQSIPEQNELPQVFEAIEQIEARPEWNKLLPQITMPQSINSLIKQLYLKGIDTQLQPGDAIILVGSSRIGDPKSAEYSIQIVKKVIIFPDQDPDKAHSIVSWDDALDGSIYAASDSSWPKVFALRQRAFLFGYNAPDFRSMPDKYSGKGDASTGAWNDFNIQAAGDSKIDLDRVYPKILKDGWIVLLTPGQKKLYKLNDVTNAGRDDYGLTGTVSRLELDSNDGLSGFDLRSTIVLAQSEELPLSEVPFSMQIPGSPTEDVKPLGMLTPVEGDQIFLDRAVGGLLKGRALIIEGKKIRIKIISGEKKGNVYQVLESPIKESGFLKWHLKNADFEGYVTANPDDVMLMPAFDDDETVAEVAFIDNASSFNDQGNTILKLLNPLKNTYDRSTVAIHANAAHATNGSSMEEVIGYGDASLPFQKFALKRSPLTYISASASGGKMSTLRIKINGILWDEVPTFYGLDGQENIFITRIGDDGQVAIQFGDGITGARLPTGAEVKASYRVGTGLQGLVKAEQIKLLMTRPLGVKGVINPGPPDGAEDPEPRDQARRNAPFGTLTFDRIVSLKDYEDYASAFSGVGKAKATWQWMEENRVVRIIVAAAGGSAVDASSDLIKNLRDGIINSGNPYQPFQIDPYHPIYFNISAKVQLDYGYNTEDVFGSIRAALKYEFSFDRGSFGRMVNVSDLESAIQGVKGVRAVDLDRTSIPDSLDVADLLMINPDGIALMEMKQ